MSHRIGAYQVNGGSVFWKVRVTYFTTRRHHSDGRMRQPFRKEFEDLIVIARNNVEASGMAVNSFRGKNVWVSTRDISTEILCASHSLCQLAGVLF